MVKILFVCHGNICRSPMAEIVMKDLVRKAGREGEFRIESAATSTEEIGNPVHRGTVKELAKHGITTPHRAARQLRRSDGDEYDLIIGMDSENMYYLRRMLDAGAQPKCRKLLEFTGSSADVADPWYTGNFRETYRDVLAGCTALLEAL